MISLAQTVADPPATEHLLLENPWPVFIVLIGVAAVLRVVAQRQSQPRLNWLALVAVVLAASAFLLAHFVQTTREQVANATTALLDATVSADTSALDQVIDPKATVTDERGNVKVSVGEVRAELDRALERYALASQRSKDLAVAPQGDGDTAIVYLDLRTSFVDDQFPPMHTTWLLTWHRGDDAQWKLVEARWLEWMGRQPPWFGWR